MKLQPVGSANDVLVAVKSITKDGMPETQHVHAELMTAPGDGKETNACGISFMFLDMPPSHGLPAGLMANVLARSARPIDRERQINRTLVLHDAPFHASNVLLGQDSSFKLKAKMTLHLTTQRKHDQARGITIKPVNHQSFRDDVPNA